MSEQKMIPCVGTRFSRCMDVIKELRETIKTQRDSNIARLEELRETIKKQRDSNIAKDIELEELRESNRTKDAKIGMNRKMISELKSFADEIDVHDENTLKRKRDPTTDSGATGASHEVGCKDNLGGRKKAFRVFLLMAEKKS